MSLSSLTTTQFRVQGLGLGLRASTLSPRHRAVWGAREIPEVGLEHEGLGSEVEGLGFGVECLGCKIYCQRLSLGLGLRETNVLYPLSSPPPEFLAWRVLVP